MDRQPPKLFVQSDQTTPPIVLDDASSWTLGRGDDNALVFNDHCMSREHAMIQSIDGQGFCLIDLGSRNGTFVNQRRVSVPVRLTHRDVITLGQTQLLFSCPNQEAPHKTTIPSIDLADPVLMNTNVLHVRRLISVLVVDIRNFTGLTHQLDERVLSEVVGAWFQSVGSIIGHHGSWVDKYIGDAVMAVWIHGSQEVNNEEILRPLKALKALHDMTSKLHQRYPLPFPLKIGAGLNTGYAMVGNTGSGDRPDYTALGDTVNAAFRLESSTKQVGMDVALGQRTFDYLQNDEKRRLFQRRDLELKGYSGLSSVYVSKFKDLVEYLQ